MINYTCKISKFIVHKAKFSVRRDGNKLTSFFYISDNEKLNCDYALTQCIKSSDLVTPNYRDHLVNKAGTIEIQS